MKRPTKPQLTMLALRAYDWRRAMFVPSWNRTAKALARRGLFRWDADWYPHGRPDWQGAWAITEAGWDALRDARAAGRLGPHGTVLL